ncbi:hypothetical protein VNI00_015694 [Paramarasmius palmivorus]|uniref:F-box domain-containing protein n=1 Tax=Paramarasmius palmivorus TaxID=297713 RepID=A0AAW0BJ37_9AGAR
MSVVPVQDVLKTTHSILCFPTELLCEIFKYLIPQRPEDNFGLVLTHVCRHWRETAIGLHFLWTFLDFRSPELAKEMLKRSGQAPLRIHFKHCYSSTGASREYHIARMQLLSEALSHSHRLETIEFPYIDDFSLYTLAEEHTKAAPLLRSLYITSDYDDECSLPLNFLGGTAPLLVDMALKGCGLAYNSPLLSNLTSLKLTGGYETVLEERFCDALHFMPVLECLCLCDVYCRAPATNTPVANLPMLRKLDIKWSYLLNGSRLFNHISFPGTAVVKITTLERATLNATLDEVDTFLVDVTRVFSPDFCPGYERDVKTLAATCCADTTSFTLRAWHTPLPSGFSTGDSLSEPSEHAALYPPNFSTRITWSKKGSARYGDHALFEAFFKATFRRLHVLEFPVLEMIAFPADLMKYALTSDWPSRPLRKLILHGSRYVEQEGCEEIYTFSGVDDGVYPVFD